MIKNIPNIEMNGIVVSNSNAQRISAIYKTPDDVRSNKFFKAVILIYIFVLQRYMIYGKVT